MIKTKTVIEKLAALLAIFALVLGGAGVNPAAAQTALWDVSGDFVININLNGDDPDANYPHEVSLSQDASGNLTGSGTSSGGTFAWEVTSGSVDGNTIQIDAEYTADASADGTIFTLDGTIAADGSMSGTWSDNYQGGERVGTWSTAAGVATEIESPETVTVTIVKYVDDEVATAESTGDASFSMNASWDADNIGAGSGSFSLSGTGFNNDNAYYATTAEMSSQADYSVSETLDSQTGASCDVDGVEYALTGYSVGNTLEEAENAAKVDEVSLTDITSDKYIIVWNDDCATEDNGDGTVNVSIVKYVDGELATSESTGGDSFTMNASWDDSVLGSGSGTYSLASDNDTPYTAVTVDLQSGADYSTSEALNSQTGASCDVDGVEYALVGYHVGDTLEEAENSAMVSSVSLNDLTEDKYVIVLNDLCSTPDNDGTIGGDVIGDGELQVTSVETLDGSAIANNSYEDGWKFRFNITVPTDENGVAMKFGNWEEDGIGTDTFPTANNVRISSAQADNGGATITVTGADTYTTPDLNITGDLDPTQDGLQIQVLVEVKIPSGTDSGSYSTTYGVRSQ